MPPLKVATFGKKGVNVVDSPLHLSDDDLTAAQNAEIFFEDGYPAIRKRLGMTAGVSAAMDGAVFALTSIPLPDPSPATAPASGLVVLIGYGLGTSYAYLSTDGGTWDTDALGAMPMYVGTAYVQCLAPLMLIGSDYHVVYFNDNANELEARKYSNPLSQDTVVVNDIKTGATESMTALSSQGDYETLWLIITDSFTGDQTMKRVQLSAATVNDWSDTYGGTGDWPAEWAWTAQFFDDVVIVVTTEMSGGFRETKFRSAPTDSPFATTIEHTITSSAANDIDSWSAVAGGTYLIVAGYPQDASGEAQVWRRDTDANWTEVYRSAVGRYWLVPVFSSGSELMFWEWDQITGDMILKRSTDGGSNWSDVLTRSAPGAPYTVTHIVYMGGSYYWTECVDLNSDVNVYAWNPTDGDSVVLNVPFGLAHQPPIIVGLPTPWD